MFLDKTVDVYVDRFLRERELWYFSFKEKVFLFRELAYLIEWWVAIADSVIIMKWSTDKWSVQKICDDMFDALNNIQGNTGEIQFWDIGFLEVWNSTSNTFWAEIAFQIRGESRQAGLAWPG